MHGSVSLFFLLFLCRVVRKQVNLLRQILRHRRLVQQVIGAEGQPAGQQGFIYDPVIQLVAALSSSSPEEVYPSRLTVP